MRAFLPLLSTALLPLALGYTYPPTRGSCSLQEKLAQLAPFPIAPVLIDQPGFTLTNVSQMFQQMATEGFTAVKQILLGVALEESQASYLNRTKQWFHAALDAGLSPWWYEKGGWECFTNELLNELGLPLSAPPWDLERAPSMVAYQTALQRARIDAMTTLPQFNLGEPGAGNPIIPPALAPAFSQWLNTSYGGDLTALLHAWQDPYRGNFSFLEAPSFDAAAALLTQPTGGWPSHDYRRYRDSMRFQADAFLAKINASITTFLAMDPNAPVRTGGASLQLNQAYYSWDMFGQGRLAGRAGSFYISSHLPWHYAGFQHEVDRPVLFEVSWAVAAAGVGGAWPGEWESSGGPAQYSGGQSTAVGPGGITKLLLSYIAMGMRGVGVWTYNGRPKGQEMGEYALTGLAGKPSLRSAAAGAISKACAQWRWELWAASNHPVVAILYSWENEAIAGRLSMQEPTFECDLQDLDCKYFNGREQGAPNRARFGWVRALVDAHVPFTHVDETQIREGGLTALGVKVLVLPHALGIPTDLLPAIAAWQAQGGRVVADMPYLLMDAPSGWLHDQSSSPSATLFGAYVSEFHSTEAPFDGQAMAVEVGPNNTKHFLGRGQYAALEVVEGAGRVSQHFLPPFDDIPALIETTPGGGGGAGAGSGALINFEAGSHAALPTALTVASPTGALANVSATLALSQWMASVATQGGALGPAWSATPFGIPVFLRSSDFNGTSVRHFFALYDDLVAPSLQQAKGVQVTLSLPWGTSGAADAVTGETLDFTSTPSLTTLTFSVGFRSGRWVRTVDS